MKTTLIRVQVNNLGHQLFPAAGGGSAFGAAAAFRGQGRQVDSAPGKGSGLLPGWEGSLSSRGRKRSWRYLRKKYILGGSPHH